MPLWNIYHPQDAFSDADKQAIAERITALYTDLPKFSVGLVFHPVPKSSFFIGGERADLLPGLYRQPADQAQRL